MGEVVFASRLRAADKAASLPFGSFIAIVHSSKSRSGCRGHELLFVALIAGTRDIWINAATTGLV